MGVLRFESQNTGRRNSLKISFLIFLLISTGLLGYTLAANINLNSGGAVEFGQGVTRTTACDNQVNVTPFSNFVNESGAGSHLLTSLKISGIDSTSDKCSGKTFVIKAYADSGQLNLFNYTDNISNINYNSIEIYDNAGLFSWISGGTDGNDIVNDENVGNPGRDLSDTSFTVNLTSNANPIIRTALASAASIKRITVETYDGRLLNNRILNASQFGIFLTQTNLSLGLNPTESLPGGNFNMPPRTTSLLISRKATRPRIPTASSSRA